MYEYKRQVVPVKYSGLCRQRNIKRLTVFLTVLSYGNLLVALSISVVSRILFDDSNTLAFPSYFPWNTTTSNFPGYLCALISQTLLGYYVSSLTLGNIVYITLIYLEFKRQYKRLRTAVGNIITVEIATEAANCCSKIKNPIAWKSRQEKFTADLIECIDHHRILRK